MKMRSLAVAGTIMLATVTTAAAQTQQQPQAANPNGQYATMRDQEPGAQASRSDWFISPNDPRYQLNGAPRAGQEPVFNTPYAPIQSGGGDHGGGQ